MHKLTLNGRVKNGKPQMFGMDRWYEFFKVNEGKSFFLELLSLETGSVDFYVWYIVKAIAPAFIDGHRHRGKQITIVQALEEISSLAPYLQDEMNRRQMNVAFFDTRKFVPDCELPAELMADSIEYLHKYCAENFNIIVGNYKSI